MRDDVQLSEDITAYITPDVNMAMAFLMRGKEYQSRGEHQKAIDDYIWSIVKQPHNPKAYIAIANVNYMDQVYHTTILFCTSAINQQPHNPEAYCLRGQANLHIGQVFEALEDFKAAQRQGMVGLEKSISTTTFFVTAAMRTISPVKDMESDSMGMASSSLTTSTAQSPTSPHISGTPQTSAPSCSKDGTMPQRVCAER